MLERRKNSGPQARAHADNEEAGDLNMLPGSGSSVALVFTSRPVSGM